ncbi:MAG: acylphosphatase [Spirochaetia bacterium]|nr:acylphosphatase [Spirochaetia bacterium]
MQAELFRIRGRVQGVGFRYFVLSQAQRLGVSGYVRNQNDGSVECLAQGSQSDLDDLENALKQGPPGSQVTSVDRTPAKPAAHSGFRVVQ